MSGAPFTLGLDNTGVVTLKPTAAIPATQTWIGRDLTVVSQCDTFSDAYMRYQGEMLGNSGGTRGGGFWFGDYVTPNTPYMVYMPMLVFYAPKATVTITTSEVYGRVDAADKSCSIFQAVLVPWDVFTNKPPYSAETINTSCNGISRKTYVNTFWNSIVTAGGQGEQNGDGWTGRLGDFTNRSVTVTVGKWYAVALMATSFQNKAGWLGAKWGGGSITFS